MTPDQRQYVTDKMKTSGFTCPYASLAGPMIGVFYPLPFEDEGANRFALNRSKLAKLWCSVYDAERCAEMERDNPDLIFLHPNLRHALDYSTHGVELDLLNGGGP